MAEGERIELSSLRSDRFQDGSATLARTLHYSTATTTIPNIDASNNIIPATDKTGTHPAIMNIA